MEAKQTASDFTAALLELGWSLGELARRLGLSPSTPGRWAAGSSAIPRWASEHVRLLLVLRRMGLLPQVCGACPPPTDAAAMLQRVSSWLVMNGGRLPYTFDERRSTANSSDPRLKGFRRLVDEAGNPRRRGTLAGPASSPDLPRDDGTRDEFLILPEVFRLEVCDGFTADEAARMLKRRGHLVHEADRLTVKQRLPGMGKRSVYHIRASVFIDAEARGGLA